MDAYYNTTSAPVTLANSSSTIESGLVLTAGAQAITFGVQYSNYTTITLHDSADTIVSTWSQNTTDTATYNWSNYTHVFAAPLPADEEYTVKIQWYGGLVLSPLPRGLVQYVMSHNIYTVSAIEVRSELNVRMYAVAPMTNLPIVDLRTADTALKTIVPVSGSTSVVHRQYVAVSNALSAIVKSNISYQTWG